jgi:putative oxidoreductase
MKEMAMSSPVTGPAGRGNYPGYAPSGLRHSAAGLWDALLGGTARLDALERYGALAARVLVAQIFLISGVMKVLDPSGTQHEMAEHGMFLVPFFFLGAVAFELLGGLSLLLGYKARLGALALLLYLIPVTLVFHHFWTMTGEQQRNNMLFFMHNLALMGGLLLVVTFGAGPLSLDGRARRVP